MKYGPFHSIEELVSSRRDVPAGRGSLLGHCNGTLMASWGENLTRRFGPNAASDLLVALGPDAAGLMLAPSKRDWIPVVAQLRVTELIVERHFAGSWSALYPALAEDTRRGSGRVALLLLRKLGPAKVLGYAPRSFSKLYDRGVVEAEVSERRATLRLSGAEFFGLRSWQLLQVFGQRVLIELAGYQLERFSVSGDEDSCELSLEWARR